MKPTPCRQCGRLTASSVQLCTPCQRDYKVKHEPYNGPEAIVMEWLTKPISREGRERSWVQN